MIHVEIASQLTPTGVAGVRWVLLDTSDAVPVADASAVATPAIESPGVGGAGAGAQIQPWPAEPARPALRAWTLAIIGLGLAVALLGGRWQLGAPTLPALKPAAAPALMTPPAGVAPAPAPADPADPAASSAHPARVITAGRS